MCQSENPEFGAAPAKIRMRKPTDEDIDMLNSRVVASLDTPTVTLIVVYRHTLRNIFNMENLLEAS